MMLYSTLLFAAAALSGLVAAQNSSTNPDGLPPNTQACCSVDAGGIPSTQKTAWCNAQENTCPEICGGQGQIASGGNDCDDRTLKYTCKCRNGTEPPMAEYQQSVPGQMCRFWFNQCINNTFPDGPGIGEGNERQQFVCRQVRDSQCGNKTTRDAAASSSSSSGTSRPTSTSGSGSASGSQTSSVAGGASSTPGAAMRLAKDFGTPVLAGGMIAFFGLAL